jgi:hypothetical protein
MKTGPANGKWNLGQYVIARIGLAVERARALAPDGALSSRSMAPITAAC